MTSPKAANLADSSGVTVPGPAERLTLPQLREFVEELTRSGVEIKDAAVSVLPVSPSGAVKLQQRGPTKKNDQGAHVPESFKMAMQPAAAGRLDKNDHELGRLNAPTASPDEKVEALLFAAVRETDEEMGWKAAKAVRAALGRAMKEASDSVDVYLNWNANEGKNRLDVTFVLNLRKS